MTFFIYSSAHQVQGSISERTRKHAAVKLYSVLSTPILSQPTSSRQPPPADGGTAGAGGGSAGGAAGVSSSGLQGVDEPPGGDTASSSSLELSRAW